MGGRRGGGLSPPSGNRRPLNAMITENGLQNVKTCLDHEHQRGPDRPWGEGMGLNTSRRGYVRRSPSRGVIHPRYIEVDPLDFTYFHQICVISP